MLRLRDVVVGGEALFGLRRDAPIGRALLRLAGARDVSASSPLSQLAVPLQFLNGRRGLLPTETQGGGIAV